MDSADGVGLDAVIHGAALHASHVELMPHTEFHRINVQGTHTLAMLARDAEVSRFVFTGTTALYGHAIVPCRAAARRQVASSKRDTELR